VSWLLLLLAVCGAAMPARGAEPYWNGFRGPAWGVSPWTNAPVSWDGAGGKGVLWKTPLTMTGVGSPVIWDRQLYLTEGDQQRRFVLAFDVGTGKPLWRRLVTDGGHDKPLPPVSPYGLAMPTPACDANGVYALFGTGDLIAFSPDGRLLWKTFLGRPVIGYGFSSSPCVSGGTLFVQIDHHASGRIIAFDAATGRMKWEVERSRGASWSSLMMVPGEAGKSVVVVNANGSTSGYDFEGERVWDIDGATGEVAPSPAWWEGRIYAVNVGSKLFCHSLKGEPQKLWEVTGALSDTASPVVTNGLLYMSTGGGAHSCWDAVTGEELWDREGPGCYASLIVSGDRVYALGRDGTCVIYRASRTCEIVGTCKLGEGVDATPAMTSDGRFYIRGSRSLWCIGGDVRETKE
jgi:outer membrane protein assembly factor BamB